MVVKERIKELLYSWKVGLPHETKINDAYLMLKREGMGREGGREGEEGGREGEEGGREGRKRM